MEMSMHDLAIESFAPMLGALAEILEKGAGHAQVLEGRLFPCRRVRCVF